MEYTTKVRDLLVNSPVKKKLMSRIVDSERQKIRQPLTMEEIGHHKPTQLFVKCNNCWAKKRLRQFTFTRTIFATAPS